MDLDAHLRAFLRRMQLGAGLLAVLGVGTIVAVIATVEPSEWWEISTWVVLGAGGFLVYSAWLVIDTHRSLQRFFARPDDVVWVYLVEEQTPQGRRLRTDLAIHTIDGDARRVPLDGVHRDDPQALVLVKEAALRWPEAALGYSLEREVTFIASPALLRALDQLERVATAPRPKVSFSAR